MQNSLENLSEIKLQPQYGLEISGLDLSQPISDEVASYILNKFNQYSVLLFRNQKLDDAQQIAFSRLFGELEQISIMTAATNQYVYRISNIDNREKILAADSNKRKLLNVNTYWHIDSSFKSPPAMASILYGKEIPEDEVTSTAFCSLSHGYDCLSPAQKKRIHNLTCRHDYKHSLKRVNMVELPEYELKNLSACRQPMVHIHPDNSTQCLYLSGHISSIDGLSEEEGEQLLDDLFKTVINTDTLYEHNWQQNDLLIWDNRCVMHRVTNIPAKEIRRVHRTTVRCPAPLIAASATI